MVVELERRLGGDLSGQRRADIHIVQPRADVQRIVLLADDSHAHDGHAAGAVESGDRQQTLTLRRRW